MRTKIGRATYTRAALWPRLRYVHGRNDHGGGSSLKQQQADLEEVRAYLTANPDATTFDVSLVCHLSDKHARKLMRKL